jgi:hypothetical protein
LLNVGDALDMEGRCFRVIEDGFGFIGGHDLVIRRGGEHKRHM